MNELLTCSLCFEFYNTSKKLPLSLLCGHTYCKDCLSILSANKPVTCPLDHQSDARPLSQIPKNFSLIEIIEHMSTSPRFRLSTFLLAKQKTANDCSILLQELETAKKNSKELEKKTLAKIAEGFNRVREAVSVRESEMISSVSLTHEAIAETIKAQISLIGEIIKKSKEDIESLEQVKEKQGDIEVDESKYGGLEMDFSGMEKVRQSVESLPIKVMISPEKIENSIQDFTKIIDDTRSRGSGLTATFVSDVRVQPNDRFPPNSTFVKTWRVRNDGASEWPNNCWCVFSHGDFSGESVVVDPAWPAEEIDVSVVMISPEKTGSHSSAWRLVDPNGLTFGPLLTASISVFPLS
jgi:hypothetical protein